MLSSYRPSPRRRPRVPGWQRFAEQCLPRYFKHNKLATFQQQLQTYGFKRVPAASHLDRAAVWCHPNFRQHQQAMLVHITRDPMRRANEAASVPQTPSSPLGPFSPLSLSGEFGQAMELGGEEEDNGEWGAYVPTLHEDIRRMCGAIDSLRQQLDM